MAEKDPITGVETTGHVWDETLQEFNNPLPRWWLWAFYGSVVFAIVYWTIYPSWPIGKSYLKGVMNDITYKTDAGEEITTHWNTRALLQHEMQNGEMALAQKAELKKIEGMSYDAIAKSADTQAFVQSFGKGIFGDYCAGCHQTGGIGVIGAYPNLSDDAWLWGGTTTDIENTIRNGHLGFMPSFKGTLSDVQIDETAHYVLSLSGEKSDAGLAANGEKIFQGQTGGCYLCHTKEATGMKEQGAANLTDQIWTMVDVKGLTSEKEKLDAVKSIIEKGVNRTMPAWNSRLDDTQIKVLTAYINSFGGGK
ncbi:MAG: cytochrome-c oxidase, cbb3-type subunit III [Cocleimonas sp.]|nr:cytochrome-c oxidase, cbb3-type subunit III [Cocleimonas sp.]